VKTCGNNWDDFVDCDLMAHWAIPHSATRYNLYYLLYGREMRLPSADDLIVLAPGALPDDSPVTEDHISGHLTSFAIGCKKRIAQ
jgi:hypothetical protein